MAKFALECPHCGVVNKASTFFLAKKVIVCENCKKDIHVKASRMAIGECQKCGSVAFDQAKGTCPICRSHIHITDSSKAKSVEQLQQAVRTPLFECPECGCEVQVTKGSKLACPVCDHSFAGYEEIFKIIQKDKLVSTTNVSVIKYEGDNSTFVWKHPIEDFNLGSQLIVHESQEAIFFMNGQALDLFGPGRYSLETENLPILKKTYDIPTDKQNPFHAEVYFINKTVQMGIKWGTDSRVRFIEPETKIPLDIGASGELSLQVADSRKLLVKLVGTTGGLSRANLLGFENKRAQSADINYLGNTYADAVSNIIQATNDAQYEKGWADSVRGYFRPLVMTSVKSNLANAIKTHNINILEIDEKLDELSNSLREKVTVGFEEFGLTVPQLFVTNVSLPETDPNFKKLRSLLASSYLDVRSEQVRRDIELERETTETEKEKRAAERTIIAAQAEAEKRRLEGFADAEVMRAKGYDHKDELQAEVQKAYAAGIGNMGGNGGAGGSMMSDMVGLGAGLAAMGVMGNQVGEAMKGMIPGTEQNTAPAADGWKCGCGHEGNHGKFCEECGKAKPEPWTCECGTENTGKFCSECGKQKPQAWDCPNCGKKGNTGKFCSECGGTPDAPKNDNTWDCPCGATGNTGKFCAECGKKREDNE